MLEDVYADFTELPKQGQIKLFNHLKSEFFSNGEDEMKDTFTTIRETPFSEGLGCVHCGSVKVK